MSSPSRRAWRCRGALLLFVGVTFAMLGADVAVKYWAFRHVAGVPLRLGEPLKRASGWVPTIEQFIETSGEWVMLDAGPDRHPASAIPAHPGRVVVPYLLELRLVVNTGAVFGIGQGRQTFFVIMSIFATGIVVFLFARSGAKQWMEHLSLGLLLAGAWGNLYDRFIYAGVRDMFHLFPGIDLPFDLTWPGGATELYPWIFNVADVSLVVGIISLFIQSFFADRRRRSGESAPG